jgi:hypothetical protein
MRNLMRLTTLKKRENLDDVGNEGLIVAMKNMTIGDIKPKDEKDDDQSTLFQVLPSSYASHKDQVVMWKGMKNQFINRLIILHLSLLKMQVLN